MFHLKMIDRDASPPVRPRSSPWFTGVVVAGLVAAICYCFVRYGAVLGPR